MTLGDTLKSAIQSLAAANVPSPRMNAEILLMFTLSCDRAYLYGHSERELTAEEDARYQLALAQRSTGIPAQYITGHQEFWGMDLIVSPAVLIPRPETEHVIEAVLDCAALTFPSERSSFSGSIADVGTGSGCIALALARELPHARIHATDVFPAALEIARANAVRHGLETRIHFHETDLLEGTGTAAFDLLVSNPPYVGESEEEQVQLEVRKFEPRAAVFAGPSGMEVIERLISQARTALKPGGWLVMEISGTIADRVRASLADWTGLQITNDLQGIPRVVTAKRP